MHSFISPIMTRPEKALLTNYTFAFVHFSSRHFLYFSVKGMYEALSYVGELLRINYCVIYTYKTNNSQKCDVQHKCQHSTKINNNKLIKGQKSVRNRNKLFYSAHSFDLWSTCYYGVIYRNYFCVMNIVKSICINFLYSSCFTLNN